MESLPDFITVKVATLVLVILLENTLKAPSQTLLSSEIVFYPALIVWLRGCHIRLYTPSTAAGLTRVSGTHQSPVSQICPPAQISVKELSILLLIMHSEVRVYKMIIKKHMTKALLMARMHPSWPPYCGRCRPWNLQTWTLQWNDRETLSEIMTVTGVTVSESTAGN